MQMLRDRKHICDKLGEKRGRRWLKRETREENFSVLKVFCGNYVSLCIFLNSFNHMQKSNVVYINFKVMNVSKRL